MENSLLGKETTTKSQQKYLLIVFEKKWCYAKRAADLIICSYSQDNNI